MGEYEDYEKQCEVIRRENKELLHEFSHWLVAKGLKPKTVRRHCENVKFYINDFLLHSEMIRAVDGAADVGMFLSYWFIKKAMWSSPESIRANAASLKKFYGFVFEKGAIDKATLDDLKALIKEEMPDWIATVQRYDDPSIDDVWQF